MALGGIIAGALGGGAQAVGGIAQQQLDLNDKQTMAKYNSDLEGERASAAARLRQTLDRENLLWQVDQTPGGYADKARQNTVANETASAVGKAAPEVLAAGAKIEDNKGREMAPGAQVVRDGKVVAENKRPTVAEVNQELYKSGLKGGTGKVDHFDAKEIDTGLKEVVTNVRKDFVDEATQRPIASAGSIAMQAYNAAIDAGRTPAQAQQVAYSAVSNIADEGRALMTARKDQKLTMDAAMRLALKMRQDKLSKPAAAAAPAATPPVAQPPVAAPAATAPTGPGDPKYAGMSLFTLQNMANSPRSGRDTRAAAQAEIDRRAAAQPTAPSNVTIDTNTD